ncbi:MAG: phosphoenolpyruvate hydrolase family protein [Lachnospiraceae bacterium]|nr:phosphoenolpyruvate hydrolase family protein [Lachnospiraceae bacterium]
MMQQVECRVGREVTLQRMREKIRMGIPVVVSGAGVGIVGRILEKAGADMAVVYNSGYFRMNGHSSILGNLPVGDANGIVYRLGRDLILPVTHDMPVAAGVFGCDPTRDMEAFLYSLAETGYSGIINYPTVGKFEGKFRKEIESVGLGYKREASMMKLAHDMGFLTIGYVYTPEEARVMVQQGVDILAAHAGLTSGGDIGSACAATISESVQVTEEVLSAGLSENKDIIALCHGGAIEDAQAFERIFRETCAVGFVGASSMERIPVERAIHNTVQEFQAVRK